MLKHWIAVSVQTIILLERCPDKFLVSGDVKKIVHGARRIQDVLEQSQNRWESSAMVNWLNPSDPWINLEKAKNQRHKGTCLWLHDSKPYRKWKSQQNSFLWLHGLSGCGKTVLASSVIDQTSLEDKDSVLLFFYFDFSDNTKQKLAQMLRTLLNQLYTQNAVAKAELDDWRYRFENSAREPTVYEMCKALKVIICQLTKVLLVIDAVDESQEQIDVVRWIKDIHSWGVPGLHMFITSQKVGSLDLAITQWPCQDEIWAVKSSDIDTDIREYVNARLYEGREFVKWDHQRGLREGVKHKVLQKSNGM